MEIVKVFKTSKGVFWSENDATRKLNRKYETNEFGEKEYEPVVPVFALTTGKSDEIFLLQQIKVQ